MARSNRVRLDALSALDAVMHARATSLLRVSWTGDKKRTLCMTHLEQVAHAMRSSRKKGEPLKLETLNDIDKIIARSDIEDLVRAGKWAVFSVTPTSDVNWLNCPHCRRRERCQP